VVSGGIAQNGADIIITTNGSFATGNIFSQTVMILHELGHAMNDIFGAGTSGILNDDSSVPNNTQVSMQNTSLIVNECFFNGAPPTNPILLP